MAKKTAEFLNPDKKTTYGELSGKKVPPMTNE